jgi:enamine deaminase RidA (YjgF/YER057c/UK114 family)
VHIDRLAVGTARGYPRAVREADLIFVTGTVGIEPDGRFGPMLKAQTRKAVTVA